MKAIVIVPGTYRPPHGPFWALELPLYGLLVVGVAYYRLFRLFVRL